MHRRIRGTSHARSSRVDLGLIGFVSSGKLLFMRKYLCSSARRSSAFLGKEETCRFASVFPSVWEQGRGFHGTFPVVFRILNRI